MVSHSPSYQIPPLSVAACLVLTASTISFVITSRSLAAIANTNVRESARLQLEFDGRDSSIKEYPIPDALKPVTFHGCCGNDTSNLFPYTCLTEWACNSTIYPFRSQQEADMFRRWLPSPKEHWELTQQCEKANAEMTPLHDWCNTTSFPFGCSTIVGMGGGSGPYDRVFLFPQGKLAFCGIPKAGITQWLHLLRFMMGAKDYQSVPYCKKDLESFRFDRMTPELQARVWTSNSSWTKAVFLREPAERLLSAYLDKVKTKTGQRNPPYGKNVSFAQFIDILSSSKVQHGVNETHGAMTGLSWMSDPHWRPQAWSCGLSENLPDFDYIGTLDRAAYHSKALLQKVNLWEPFGKHYRVTERGKHKEFYGASITYPPEPLKPGQVALGFQQEASGHERFSSITTRHSRGSSSKFNQYYTPELLEEVKKLYWMDFALWNAVQEAQKEGLVRGKDIVSKLNPDCDERKKNSR